MTFMNIVSVLSPILIAIIAGLFAMETRSNRTARAKSETRAALRTTESLLALRLMFATVLLSDATALAVQQQKTNGEMTAARKEAAEAKAEYEEFVRQIAARQVTKV